MADTNSKNTDYFENKQTISTRLPYFIVIYLGFCTLASWNVILSIMDFFQFYVRLINL
jgi:hypothetical protein